MSLNITNRVIVTLMAAAAASACVVAVLALFGVWFPDPTVFGTALAAMVGNLNDLSGAQAVGVGALLVVLFVASALLVGLELRPARTRPYLIAATDMGDVVVERSTVVEFVEHVGRQVSGVAAIIARVALLESGGLAIRCTVTVDTKSVLADLAEELREQVTEKVEGQLGLGVTRIDTRFRMTQRRHGRPVVK